MAPIWEPFLTLFSIMISSYYFLAQKRITGNWMPENEYELIKINSDSMESCDRWLTENYPKRDGWHYRDVAMHRENPWTLMFDWNATFRFYNV